MGRKQAARIICICLAVLLIMIGYRGGYSPPKEDAEGTAVAAEVEDVVVPVVDVVDTTYANGSNEQPVQVDVYTPPVQPEQPPAPVVQPNPQPPEQKPKPEQPTPTQKPSQAKRVALTFDDGPDDTFTTQILDLLKARGVKATFFVVGIQVVKHPDIMKRIVEEGHALGNHSWRHGKMTTMTAAELQEDITKSNQAIIDAIGTGATLFRPPYGAVNDEVRDALAAADQELLLWNVDTRDWAGTTPEEMMQFVKKQTKPGSIMLMHSFGGKNGDLSNTVEALPIIIDYLHEHGYEIVTVPELQDSDPKRSHSPSSR